MMASVLRNLRFASAVAKFEFQASSPAGTLSLQPAGVWNTGSPLAAIAAKQRSDDTAAVFKNNFSQFLHIASYGYRRYSFSSSP